MSFHVGVDVGGTFTDLFAVDADTGAVVVEKADTTEDAVSGVLEALARSAIPPGDIRSFVFGSTLATNALVEGKTDPVAFVGTEGFTDVLEIRRLWREHLFGWRWERPKALVPHCLRFGVPGRIDWQGEEMEPLDLGAVDRTVTKIRRRGIRSVAVSLLFSFMNPAHERQVKARFAELAPDLIVVLSCDVNPEIKEYERASTSVVAAALSPLVDRLLQDLETRLAEAGVPVAPQVIKSNGGIMSSASARAKPLEIMRSGPAGGVASALRLSRELGEPNLIGIDIGGTTADVSVITDGAVTYARQAHLAWDIPIRVGMADVRSVGAGGGSIAWIDAATRLHVGPQSAGSMPGPVCYRRGGEEPTVTDAALVAGLIDPNRFLGGRMKVDAEAGREAIERRVARPLSLSVEAAASGIYKLTTARMAQLIGEMTVQVGLDPRDYALVGFGGAGPLFVATLAEEIEATHAIVPRYPAVWSAFGGLFADIVHDYAQSHFAKVADLDPATLNAIADALAGLARQDLERDELTGAEAEFHYACDLRYAGQSHEITVPIKGQPPLDQRLMREVEREFEDLHEKTYAHRRPEDPRELITVRLLVRVPRRLAVPEPDLVEDSADRSPPGTRPVWFHGYDRAVETKVVDRDVLPAGFRIEGPAIVEEDQSNTVVPPGMRLGVNDRGELIMEGRQP